ncbi:MAG: o-succinylbenzoate--CoA ligase [Propionibacteriaceae bacterium]
MSQTVTNWLRRRSQLTPNRVGLVCGTESWTFSEIRDAADLRSAALASYGIPANYRIGFLASNSVEHYFWLFACQQLGLQMVLLNPRLAANELQRQVDDSGLKLLLCDDKTLPLATALSAKSITFGELSQVSASGDLPIVENWSFDEVTTILYTSGTTGEAKGVMQTFGNHWWSAMASVLNLGLDPAQDSWICAVPLFHISGFSIMMRGIIYGIPIHLMERFDAADLNDLLLSGRASTVSVVTKMLSDILDDLASRQIKNYPDTVRCFLIGGGFLDDVTLARANAAAIPSVFSFGMTETASQCVASSYSTPESKAGSAGLPLFTTQLRIDSGVPAGQVGELQLRTPTLAVGYLNQQDRYNASFTDDGWFHTGDMGYLDDDGYLWVVSRLSDMIISGGENIFPAEIENVLLTHSAVQQAAVVGREDSRWGQVPVAFVVADPLLNTDALTDYCRSQLAHYKVPAQIIFLDELPQTASGKVQRQRLVELLKRADDPHELLR